MPSLFLVAFCELPYVTSPISVSWSLLCTICADCITGSHWDALLVQGEAQCCMTGAAFEHMLQLGNQSLLEIVMRNVVVFSRMKSHQKGQVMDLLGTRGLHQIVAGQQQHLPVGHLLQCLPAISDPGPHCPIPIHPPAPFHPPSPPSPPQRSVCGAYHHERAIPCLAHQQQCFCVYACHLKLQ